MIPTESAPGVWPRSRSRGTRSPRRARWWGGWAPCRHKTTRARAGRSAFGWRGDEAEDERQIYTGVNWSAAIKNPFRAFGATGEGLETVLANFRATRSEPVVFVLHLAQPRVQYADRGKSSLVIGGEA